MSNGNLRLDIAQLERTIENLLVTYPELKDDDVLRADMFEAESNLHDVLAALVDKEREAKAMAGAIKERMGELAARKKRYARQEDAMRDLIQKIMEHADLRKCTLPEATLSISFKKATPVVVDPDQLPDECVTREPNKTVINEWCAAGNIPDGVTVGNGADSLTIRVK